MQIDMFTNYPPENVVHQHENSASGRVILKENYKALNGHVKNFYDTILKGLRVSVLNSQLYGIGTTHSRAADLRKWLIKEHNITLEQKKIPIPKFNPEDKTTYCYEYFLTQESINKLKTIN